MSHSNSGALRANVVDVIRRTIMDADVRWHDGRIVAVDGCGPPHRGQPYLVPGFIDAHIHIESSLLSPAEFARIAVRHGTVACVSDPDEMANVLGVDGVHWMLANAAKTPFHFLFGVPDISTDQDCTTLAEAEEKIRAGMKILICEGSAVRNFDALHPLIDSHPGEVMFCSDHRHPDDLIRGHISQLAARAVGRGHDIFAVLQAACITPQWHYGMPLGQLRVGDAMNAALVHDLGRLRVLGAWIDGRQVAENGETLLPLSGS